jgi:uncharacterized protein
VLTKRERQPHQARFQAEVQEVREVVDPLDQATDWFNAIDWLQGEPQLDPQRLGLWGSSFSGGPVAWAEHDPRVKAIHSQVGATDGHMMTATDAERRKTYEEATRMARGAPMRGPFMQYDSGGRCGPGAAMRHAVRDRREGGAIRRATGPKNLVIIPKITHYGIYFGAHEQAQKLALAWFNKYLKK